MPDPRAVNILMDTYWGPRGWKVTGGWSAPPPRPPRPDFEYAKSKGVMFDSRRLSRSAVLKWMFRSLRLVTKRRVCDAFVVGLGRDRPDLRSGLASFAFARHMPRHSCATCEDTDGYCRACGQVEVVADDIEDLNVLNFERIKWGGVRHTDPVYTALDLELLAREPVACPTTSDRAALRAVLRVADSMPAASRASDLVRALAGVAPGGRLQRDQLVESLALCGILEPADHPSYRRAFVRYADVAEPPGDTGYPAAWWRGRDGVNRTAVAHWFPWARGPTRKGRARGATLRVGPRR